MAYAQTDRMISGIVVMRMEILPAAHIRQVSQTKGGTTAVITDMNGHFIDPCSHSERDRNLLLGL